MRNGNYHNIIASTRHVQEHELPHCLRRQYQDIIAKIMPSQDPNRGEGKNTGIWDETNRCKD